MQTRTHITDFVELHAKNTPDKAAIITGERELTWAELWHEVQAGAAFINDQLAINKSAGSQQVIATLLPNNWQHVVANLSVVHAGHMVLPIDVIFKPLEIDAVLRQVPPALIITDEAGRARINESSVPTFSVKDFPTKPPLQLANYLRMPAEKQVASLLFTSGTTGKPKVVPNTHRNHIWNIETCSKVWKWTAGDTQLVSTRLSHMLGIIMGLSGTIYHGNTLYLQDRFSETNTLEMLASGKITMFSHGPVVYAKLLQAGKEKSYDLSGVRLFISGSGPLAPALWKEFKDVFGAEILEVYGSTETGRITSNLLDERIPGSPGRALPGVELKLSKNGEVLVRSEGVFPGYLNNAQATAQNKTEDGFWKTGDIGEFEDNRLILKGRKQERIRKQGYTVSPRDVEWALHEDSRIEETFVMGIQRTNEPNDIIIYFIVGDITEAEVRNFCAANLPSVWRPDKIVILDKLPRTKNGKANVAKLREMAEVKA